MATVVGGDACSRDRTLPMKTGVINRDRAPTSNAERQRQFRERNPGYRNRFRPNKQQMDAHVRKVLDAAAALVRGEAAPAERLGGRVTVHDEVWIGIA